MRSNYGSGIMDVVTRLQPLLSSLPVQQALAILERDFGTIDSLGPIRVAEFLGDRTDVAIRADAAGAVRSLLSLCQKRS
jgi:hypothetical protein